MVSKSSMSVSRPWWIAWDAAAVIIFVAIGRSVHDHGVSVTGLSRTVWPFALGLAAGWWLVLRRGWRGASARAGSVVLAATVILGMVLRVVSGQGTAVAFIVVTIVFLGALMIGPRVAVVRRRSHPG